MNLIRNLRNLVLNFLPRQYFSIGKCCKLRYCVGRHIKGNNNNIVIGNSTLYHCNFYIKGDNNTIIIGDNCKLNGTEFWISGDNNRIVIGDYTTIGHNCQFATLEGTCITIGEDCMFSHDIRVRTSDSHSLIDMASGRRINPAQNVIIGNHCWIGMYAIILKSTLLNKNTVVAARSIVTKQFEPNVLIGGSPSKIIKKSINWDRKRI